MKPRGSMTWLACALAAAAIGWTPATPSQAQQVDASWAQAPYTQQELDQMLAPIALYPDALLAQVLMASTYPLEVVEADRFVRRNPGLSGDALAEAVERMPWDPSVQALTQFPSVLAMMSEELDWTQRLGDAYLSQREQLMDTVQALRARAHAAGTLRSTEHQQVIVQDRVIVIEPWQAGVLWVPYYNPLIVYGSWWWPAYQPFFWVPPVAYRPPYFAQVYSVGIVWGPYVTLRTTFWHDPRPVWRDRYVVVDNVRVNNVIVTRAGAQRPMVWRHDPAHRRGVEYRNPPRDRFVAPAPEPGRHFRVAPDANRERFVPDRRDRNQDGRPDRIAPDWQQRADRRIPDRMMTDRRDRDFDGRQPRIAPDRQDRADRRVPERTMPDGRNGETRELVPPAPRGGAQAATPPRARPDFERGTRNDFGAPGAGANQRRNEFQQRNEIQQRHQREDFRGNRPGAEGPRGPDSAPQRVQKPMPSPRSEPARPQMAPPAQSRHPAAERPQPQSRQSVPERPQPQFRQPAQERPQPQFRQSAPERPQMQVRPPQAQPQPQPQSRGAPPQAHAQPRSPQAQGPAREPGGRPERQRERNER